MDTKLKDIVDRTRALTPMEILELDLDSSDEEFLIEYLDLCGNIEGDFGAVYMVYDLREFDCGFGNIPWVYYVMYSNSECVTRIKAHYECELGYFIDRANKLFRL